MGKFIYVRQKPFFMPFLLLILFLRSSTLLKSTLLSNATRITVDSGVLRNRQGDG